jgi:hypothetical protein
MSSRWCKAAAGCSASASRHGPVPGVIDEHAEDSRRSLATHDLVELAHEVVVVIIAALCRV